MTKHGAGRATIEEALRIDPAAVTRDLVAAIARAVNNQLRRRGVVVAMSGGVDSSVCAALAARALGSDRVLALLMPEADSPPDDRDLAQSWAAHLGIPRVVEDITPILQACGCYRLRDEAVRRALPEYGPGWRCKIGLDGERLRSGLLSVYYLTAESPDGERHRIRLSAAVYREIVAATSFKQRVRKMLEYYHADRLHFAVLGTPNRLEYDQGFFVKGGDGLADLKPIAHLYKTQVYQLAEFLGVPAQIRRQTPATGTYSLAQTQEEFYFTLPLPVMDAVLYAHDAGLAPEEAAVQLGRPVDELHRAYADIERKRSAARYLHAAPVLAGDLAGAL
jgi:NAD+ synthase